MSDVELEGLIAGLRAGGPDLAAPPAEARAGFEALLATLPVAADLVFEEDELDGIPALRVTPPGAGRGGVLLYLHGGGYVVGSASGYRGLAAEIGRAAAMTVYAIDYRLAPEHRFPAAVDDAVVAYAALLARGTDPGSIAVAGDSAGGGLALAMLVTVRDRGLPLPAAGLLMSPWTDLACEGATMASKIDQDPSLRPDALRACAGHYLGAASPHDAIASPLHADLSGLPPLLIQVGSAEILLDDAVRTAGAAGAAGVSVRLDIWPDMVHVWQAFGFMLKKGRDAIGQAGDFLRAHTG